MAAGDPWWGAKYSCGVWERFADQANQFLKENTFGGGGYDDGGGDDRGTLLANPPPSPTCPGKKYPVRVTPHSDKKRSPTTY